MSGETYLLASRFNIRVKNNIYQYIVSPLDIPIILSKLIETNTPFSLGPSKDSSITLYTTMDHRRLYEIVLDGQLDLNIKYEKTVNIDSLDKDLKLRILNGLASSIFRETLISRGWKRSYGKLRENKSLDNFSSEYVNVYNAVKLYASNIREDHVLFIDPTYKIEFNKTLRELEDSGFDTGKFTWMKLFNHRVSFDPIRVDSSEETLCRDLDMDRVSSALRYIPETKTLIQRVDRVDTSDLIPLSPRSRRIRRKLDEEGVLRLYGKLKYICLPKTILAPVASLDNITVLGLEFPKLTIPPDKRVSRYFKVLKLIQGSMPGEVDGVEIKISPALYAAKKEDIRQYRVLTENDGDIDWRTFYEKSIRWDLLEVFEKHGKLCSDLGLTVFYPRKIDSKILKMFVRELIQSIDNNCGRIGLNCVFKTYSFDDLKSFQKIVEKEVKILGSSGMCNAILLIGPPGIDKFTESRIYAMFEYSASKNSIYPQFISLVNQQKYIREKIRRGNIGENVKKRARSIAKIILRDVFIRIGYKPVSIKPPEAIKDHRVFALDATQILLDKSGLHVGVVVLSSDPSWSSISYDFIQLGGSDVDVFENAVEGIVSEIDKPFIMVNKSHVYRLLDRTGIDELEDYVLVSVSKTHSFSRLVDKYSDRYVNPELHTIVKLRERNYNGAWISEYLAITTHANVKWFDSLTVRPLYIGIASKRHDHREILDYVISLTGLNNVSMLWLNSLPWPVHRVDRLCKKINRIAKAYGYRLVDRTMLKYL